MTVRPADRADLARVYLEFEQQLAARPPVGARLSRVQRRFDSAAAQFFGGRLGPAIVTIRGLNWELAHEEIPGRTITAHFGLQPVPSETIVFDRTAEIVLRLVRLAGTDVASEPAEYVFLVRDLETGASRRFAADETGRATFQPEELLGDAETSQARFSVKVAFDNGVTSSGRTVHLLSVPPRVQRQALSRRLDLAAEAELVPHEIIEQCRRRLRKLTATPNPMSSAELLAEPATVAVALESEVRSIERGEDPYHRRTGTYWSPLQIGGSEWPLTIHAPSTVADDDAPRPLVIALHGAGGDEFMFMRAYGAGVITELADEFDFLVAAPLTYPLTGDLSYLDALLEVMKKRYPVDANRIYLVGHSLGAVTSVAILNARPELPAAVACIAGAGRFTFEDPERHPPTLVYGARYDRIITPESLAAATERAQALGLPVFYDEWERLGHVLVVNAVIRDAIEWLLQHARSDPEDASPARETEESLR